MTAELLLADRRLPRHPAIWPDGRWVAYVVIPVSVREHRVSSLWVVPADASSPPRELTDGTTWAEAPRWAHDSASLWFIADGQLHRVRPDASGAETLTSWRTPISGHLPRAGGLRAAVVARDEPDAEDEHRNDVMVWSEQGSHDRLRLLDLGTRELTAIGGLGDRHVVEVVQRPDGGPLAVISWDRPEDEPGSFTARLHVVDPDTGTFAISARSSWTRTRPPGGAWAAAGTWPIWR